MASNGKNQIDSDDLQSVLAAVEDGQLSEDVYWAFQMMSKVTDSNDPKLKAALLKAPTPGAGVLLAYALDNPRDFFNNLLKEAFKRKKAEATLRDDGRRLLDIFEQIDEFLVEGASQ